MSLLCMLGICNLVLLSDYLRAEFTINDLSMQNDNTEILKRFSRFLEQFMELEEGLLDLFSAKLTPMYYPEDKTLFIKGQQITSTYFITDGYMTCSEFPGEQVVDIYGHDQLVAAPSFNDNSPTAYDLKVIGGTYVIYLSYAEMEDIFISFPSAERLFKFILNHYKKLDTERLVMISKHAIASVNEFYVRFPELLVKGGGMLKDSIIASYLLMDERTLGRNRAKLIASGKLNYAAM